MIIFFVLAFKIVASLFPVNLIEVQTQRDVNNAKADLQLISFGDSINIHCFLFAFLSYIYIYIYIYIYERKAKKNCYIYIYIYITVFI